MKAMINMMTFDTAMNTARMFARASRKRQHVKQCEVCSNKHYYIERGNSDAYEEHLRRITITSYLNNVYNREQIIESFCFDE